MSRCRDIGAALGLSKTTIERTIKDWRRAQREAGRDSEQAALLAKLGGAGSRVVGNRSAQRNGAQESDEFDEDEAEDEWADVAVDRLAPWEQLRWRWDHNQALLREDPTNELALFRQGHLPATRPTCPEDYERHIAGIPDPGGHRRGA